MKLLPSCTDQYMSNTLNLLRSHPNVDGDSKLNMDDVERYAWKLTQTCYLRSNIELI